MSTPDSDLCREEIRRTLLHSAGGAIDANVIAEATLRTWHKVVAQLAPVIGVRGIDALFNRSLHLTSSAFSWLLVAGENAVPPAGLKARIAGRTADDAAEACCTLLTTFTELLATLIGESLTERLLGPVWAPRLQVSEQETKS